MLVIVRTPFWHRTTHMTINRFERFGREAGATKRALAQCQQPYTKSVWTVHALQPVPIASDPWRRPRGSGTMKAAGKSALTPSAATTATYTRPNLRTPRCPGLCNDTADVAEGVALHFLITDSLPLRSSLASWTSEGSLTPFSLRSSSRSSPDMCAFAISRASSLPSLIIVVARPLMK